jgi:hypothetical protein
MTNGVEPVLVRRDVVVSMPARAEVRAGLATRPTNIWAGLALPHQVWVYTKRAIRLRQGYGATR